MKNKFYNVKLSFGFFVLLAYISIGVFGLIKFNHMPEAPMINCPYTQNGYSVCANSLIHINDWREFSNVIFPTLLLLSLLVSRLILCFFDKSKFFREISHIFYKWKYYLDNNRFRDPNKKIIKWLSLFENSPSLICVRHS